MEAATPRVQPLAEVFLGQADAQALEVGIEPGAIVRHRDVLALVESRGSKPAMAWSRRAASAAERAMGPAWSRLEAKAIMPQRETRP